MQHQQHMQSFTGVCWHAGSQQCLPHAVASQAKQTPVADNAGALTLPRVSNMPYAISERRLMSCLLVTTSRRVSAAEMAALSPLLIRSSRKAVQPLS